MKNTEKQNEYDANANPFNGLNPQKAEVFSTGIDASMRNNPISHENMHDYDANANPFNGLNPQKEKVFSTGIDRGMGNNPISHENMHVYHDRVDYNVFSGKDADLNNIAALQQSRIIYDRYGGLLILGLFIVLFTVLFMKLLKNKINSK